MTFLEFRNQLFDLICFNICQVYASQYEWDYVPSFQSPWSTGGVITYYYEMNWGCDGDFNGWFYSDNVNVNGYNFSIDRLDIINIKKQ